MRIATVEVMFLPLTNTPRDYAWGSTTAIANMRGIEPSGGPEAELWLGAHPSSPALVSDGAQIPLDQWIAADPARALSEASKLPFLLKILAAAKPLSLQAHPSRAQAKAGFARENAAGIPLDSPIRNYRDDEHKPELIVALSDEFIALSGFRPIAASIHDLQAIADALPAERLNEFIDELRERALGSSREALAWAMAYLLRGGDVSTGISRSLAAAAATEQAMVSAPQTAQTIRTLSAEYAGDPGVVLGALLNRVVLSSGEALFLPAGNLHAYLNGLGIELMSASDNVLRGGLTAKHVDVDELLRVTDFEPLLDPRLQPKNMLGPHVTTFVTPITDFMLYRYQGSQPGPRDDVSVPLSVAGIAVCVGGEVVLGGANNTSFTLRRGEACFITGDEKVLNLSGDGDVFVATSMG